MSKQLVTLDNGLRILVGTKDIHTVSTAVVVKAGMLNETDEENGISHFLEHMAFKGTKNKTAKELIDFIEQLGGNTNAYTTDDKTCYTVSLPGKYWKESCDFLADIIKNSTFPETELEKERNVIYQEYKERNADPNYNGYVGLLSLGFKNNNQGRQVLGTPENILRFKSDDLMKYYKKYYVPNNMIFAILLPNEYNIDEVVTYIKNLFGDMSSQNIETLERTKIDINVWDAMYKGGIEQSYIFLGIPAIRYESRRRAAFEVFMTIFDGGMSTRLFQVIREQLGLAYSIGSFEHTSLVSNTFGIMSITEPENEVKVINAIENVLNTMCDSITDVELEKAKNALNYNFASAFDTNGGMKYDIDSLFYLNKEFDYNQELQKINNVSKDDVKEVAKLLLQHKFSGFIVRPESEK